ncbi:hypothetical protein [Sulfitobacter sediminilitoris]|nr:hypothetical protein [Sulfitobacter sediminilitoris]
MQTLKKSFSPRNAFQVARRIIDIVLDGFEDGVAMQSKVDSCY